MIKKIIIIICFLLSSFVEAQNETANWFFGEKAGLNFNNGFANYNSEGQIITTEGCSTISSKQGDLLFYSDGVTVWSKNHEVMQNGTGLAGNDSSTQSAIIIPRPGSNSIYYIFTVDALAGENGLRYSRVDMNLNAGLGGVTSSKNILLETPTTEKITAVESSDGESIWVISHKWESNEFIAYLVSASGVNPVPVISAVGSVHGGDPNNSIGYLKASPDREKIASVKSFTDNETQVFDFNAATGQISNPITISNYTSEDIGPYGCEFSPDSKRLYVSEINRENSVTFSKIHQYDLTLNTQQQIIDSDIIIAEEEGLLGAIQQALDGKIYIAKFNSSRISIINKPNEIGLNCVYGAEAVFLGGRISRLGLPPFIQSYFFATNIFENTCFGDTTSFTIETSTTIDAILWDFGDPSSGVNNTSTSINPTHVFSSAGNYDITIAIQTEGETQFVYRDLTIAIQPPVLDLEPLSTCDIFDDAILYNLVNAIPQAILDNPELLVSFYNSIDDANIRENAIVSPANYNSIINNETIIIRLDNSNGNCFSISELELNIIDPPAIEDFEEYFFCDNDLNAQITIDVGDLTLPLENYTFLWSDSNETTSQIQVNEQGTYTVRIIWTSSITTENPDGCYSTRTVKVNASSLATIVNIEITGTTAIALVTGLGDYEYTIDNPNNTYQTSTIFTNITAGNHTMYIRDINGCGIIDEEFSIIDFPEFFTPNGDSVNDYWRVYGLSENFQSNTFIYIYDRYGKLIKQLDSDGPGWDGTFNGNPLPQSDYWFSVTLDDGRQFKDHFTLKR